ncbi:MAG: MASE3 domain-containing protein [Desulfitobacteriaceae bacterium]
MLAIRSFARRLAPGKEIHGLILQVLLVILASLLIAWLVLAKWLAHPGLWHSVTELACTAIALSIFLNFWFLDEENTSLKGILGFGFLIVAIFDLLHVYSFFGTTPYPTGHLDLSERYWILSRLTEAVVLYLGIVRWFNPGLHKKVALLLTLGNAVAISVLVFVVPSAMPVMLTEGGVTPAKIVLEYIVVLIFLLSLYTLKGNLNHEGMVTYHYVFAALLIAIPTEISFVTFNYEPSFFNVFGHVLKLAYYYFLLKGIYASAVNYPYKYLKEVLNDLPLGLLTYNEYFKVSFANRQVEELLGYKPEELQGRAASEAAKLIYGHDKMKSLALQVSSKPIRNQVVGIRNQRVDNKLILDAMPLENGGVLLIFRDAKKEQEIENLQLQTKIVLDAINSLVMVVDNSGKIVLCNKAFERLTGMSASQAEGFSFVEFRRIFEFNEDSFVAEVGSGQDPEGYPASIVNLKGEKRELISLTTPILNVDGEVIGQITVASDVTALSQERQKLQQQEKLAVLGQMAAGIVHEIRNPLTTIKGFSQILEAKATDELFREYAGILVQTADEVNKVVTDFLAFAKPRPPILQEVLVTEVIDSILVMLDSQLFVKGIKLEIVQAGEEKAIIADEAQIKQVILNIVSNGIEAMNDSPDPRLTIKTSCHSAPARMVISISDTGKGMSLEDKIKAGTPFYTTKDKGTGLGLSICYQIIKEHNGQVDIESEPGKGTTFNVVLPCRSAGLSLQKLPN